MASTGAAPRAPSLTGGGRHEAGTAHSSGEARDGVARIALTGELDLTSVQILRENLAEFEGDGVVAIMLDLSDLTFIDSSGLHAFLQANARAKANGHRLHIVGATPVARRVFSLTGTEFLVDERDADAVFD